MVVRIFSILLSLIAISCTSINAQETTILHDKTFQTESGKNLKLETSSGNVIISTWDNNSVNVKVFGNRYASEKLDFIFEGTSEGVIVKAKRDDWGFNLFNKIKVKFEIKVPRNYLTDISTAGGDIKIIDLNGNQLVKTSGGDVEVDNINGNVVVRTSGGDIKVSRINGNLSLSTSGGDIKGIELIGDIKAATSGGDIKLEAKNSKIDASTSGGDIVIKYFGENKGISLATSGGDVSLIVPSNFGANVKMKTLGGEVSCKLNTTNVVVKKSSRFEGEVNGGGAEVTMTSSGGDVTLK